ncbi:MAG: response regulator transcription factor [Candidatus Sericytochromatia bacterium]|uniref:Response regulator transcription factor n=1 Tax=Candidatus Tanganyikabacteria bacterium TaxID=2961651 RepID=A0A937X4M9_9BACT|nr:response regulator transcription factor [Candidatus Tanganyikabacteria bacterium]
MTHRILVVEDETHMLAGIEDLLRLKGYTALAAQTGPAGLETALAEKPDLMLLDVMLPGMSGFDVLRDLRGRGYDGAVIMLTAKGTDLDKARGFDLGVDDYVTKPFSVLELLGRIQAGLRRTADKKPADLDALTLGDIEVDFKAFTASRSGEPLDVGPKAIAILRCLARHRGQVVTRDQLIDDVWGRDQFIHTRTIDNHVVQLRRALGEALIHTVHGHGYRLAD